jgi:hypothetical protein
MKMAEPVGPSFVPKAVLTTGRVLHQPFEVPTEMTKSALLQGGVIHAAVGAANKAASDAVAALEPRGPAKLLAKLFGKVDGSLVHSAGQAKLATEVFWVPFSNGAHQVGHAVANPFSMFYAKRAGFEIPEDPAATQALLASITDPDPESTKFPGFKWPAPAPADDGAGDGTKTGDGGGDAGGDGTKTGDGGDGTKTGDGGDGGDGTKTGDGGGDGAGDGDGTKSGDGGGDAGGDGTKTETAATDTAATDTAATNTAATDTAATDTAATDTAATTTTPEGTRVVAPTPEPVATDAVDPTAAAGTAPVETPAPVQDAAAGAQATVNPTA